MSVPKALLALLHCHRQGEVKQLFGFATSGARLSQTALSILRLLFVLLTSSSLWVGTCGLCWSGSLLICSMAQIFKHPCPSCPLHLCRSSMTTAIHIQDLLKGSPCKLATGCTGTTPVLHTAGPRKGPWNDGMQTRSLSRHLSLSKSCATCLSLDQEPHATLERNLPARVCIFLFFLFLFWVFLG